MTRSCSSSRLFDTEIIALLLTLPRIYAFLGTSQLLNPASVPRIARTAAILSLSIVVVPVNMPSTSPSSTAP